MPQAGREVVIVEAVRTPIGRGHKEKGYYKDTHPNELLGRCYTEVIERAGIDAAEVEDVVAGCVQQYGEQMFNVARNAWLQAGLPIETPATTVDRQCGSAQQAVNFAAALIAAGVHDVVIGSGVEHMGHVPMGIGFNWVDEVGSAVAACADGALQPDPPGPVGGDDRRPVGDPALGARRARRCARTSWPTGRPRRAGSSGRSCRSRSTARPTCRDQGIRPETTIEALSAAQARVQGGRQDHRRQQLADLRRRRRGAADGAREGRRARPASPRARIVDQTTVGVDPVIMLTGPIPATQKLLERNGMKMDDIDLVEINEAFAPVVAAWRRELEPDMDRVNVNGGAMALGHPLGSTGARLMTTLLHELERSDKEVGLVTMCCGGGLGTGTLIQRV